jgi:REP element-mobilizing transposase RayT
MSRPLRITYPGAFYHITARGNEEKEIFKDIRDRQKFLSYLESATHRYGALIHVYCLMRNHYHLLLETPAGNLPEIMHHINGAYTTYFNVKRQRAGHLFQGRYKAILVERDEYAKELSRYIHLNPVRAKMVDRPEEYPWSSYGYFIGLRRAPEWLMRDFILSYFGKRVSSAQKRYRDFVHAMMGQEYKSPLKEVVSSTILGREDFVEAIKDKFLTNREVDPNLPALKELSEKPSIQEIIDEVELVFGENRSLARGIEMHLCQKYTGERLREIGRHFGIGESGVSQASRRIAVRIGQDNKLRRDIKKIENTLGLSRMKT